MENKDFEAFVSQKNNKFHNLKFIVMKMDGVKLLLSKVGNSANKKIEILCLAM